MWPPNIVGAYFLVACLMGVMLGMAVHSWIERIAAWFRGGRGGNAQQPTPSPEE